jgi:hypothetical protein
MFSTKANHDEDGAGPGHVLVVGSEVEEQTPNQDYQKNQLTVVLPIAFLLALFALLIVLGVSLLRGYEIVECLPGRFTRHSGSL